MASSSLALACSLTPSSNLKQSQTFVSNPMSTLFNNPSNTHTNKPSHLNGFKVSAKLMPGHQRAMSTVVPTEQRKKKGSEAYKEIAKDVKKARKTRDDQWKTALETLLGQIKSIQRKVETHFMDQPEVAEPMLDILDDVQKLVQIHIVNVGLEKPIETTEAMMKVAQHFQAYRHSETEDGVIPVDPRPKRTAFSPMIDMFTEVANLLYGQRGLPLYLQGNFAPVKEETPPTELRVVEGEVPSCIKGMFIRNGPNPQFEPLAKYQWMDGDGMLHATYFQDGKVTYASRYTKTSRFKQENITGQAEFPKYGDYTGAFGVFTAFTQLLKSIFVLDMSYGCGVANESIAYHAGLLMALEDFDRPYAIKIKEDGDLETLGVYDFKNNLTHNCTPHTKKDPKTGEWFVFGAAYTKPYMTYRVVAPDGSISVPVEIDDITSPTYMHDFCITENYVIIMDLPFAFNPEGMLKNNDWIYNVDTSKKPRFGIRPRNPNVEAKVQWFEFEETFFIFHNANSWEEDDDHVVLYGCKMEPEKPKYDSVPIVKSALLCRALVGENYELQYPQLYKFTFNLRTGEADQEIVAENKVEYPKINENYMAGKSRYVYANEFIEKGENIGKSDAIIKYDLEEGRHTSAKFGRNIFGSEVVFVPSDNASEEDDGYLVTYVHNEDNRKSYVYVIDAKEMEKVATLELPNRIPYGFHAIFIDEEDLEHQRSLP